MKRHVYLLEVRYATDDTHTAQWIRGLVKPWIEKIGSECFCAACSNSTGNTLLARQLLHQDFPHILSVANICHHLNNTSKDIVKLKFFDVPIKIIRSSLKTFSKSHPAKSALKVARCQKQTGPSLEAIGKTHFVTLTLSAISVCRTLPALQQVFSTPQKFDFEYKEYFQPANHKLKARKFEDDLEQLVAVGLPIAKALACLESNHANAADVFVFWHAEVQDDILDILNQCTAQLFTPDGRLYNGVYLVTVYLNAGYLSSDLLKDNNVNPLTPTDSTTITCLEEIGIHHPLLYCFVFKYLAELASNEA
ncbi:hypothetical protein D9758_014790 [Tetrapyrgos nigripes]|uniref:DUF659 domain-containing protein n=1 Tax=Tetrapyrgos nigripes TaxID=182062 RepID=A0A8H5FGJ4_9AGAR|nr:hypothetical protein D9758_014790 [Tetrapyrgos nigripes]